MTRSAFALSVDGVQRALHVTQQCRDAERLGCQLRRPPRQQAAGDPAPPSLNVLDKDATAAHRAQRESERQGPPCRLEPVHEKASLSVAADMREHGSAPNPGDELVERNDALAGVRRRKRNARTHDGDPAAHACASTGGRGTSSAMNVRHHSARLSRYQRLDPSASCMTRSTSRASSRSASAQNRRSSDSAIACSGPRNSSLTGTPNPCFRRVIRLFGTMPVTAFLSTYFSVSFLVFSALGMLNARLTKRWSRNGTRPSRPTPIVILSTRISRSSGSRSLRSTYDIQFRCVCSGARASNDSRIGRIASHDVRLPSARRRRGDRRRRFSSWVNASAPLQNSGSSLEPRRSHSRWTVRSYPSAASAAQPTLLIGLGTGQSSQRCRFSASSQLGYPTNSSSAPSPS